MPFDPLGGEEEDDEDVLEEEAPMALVPVISIGKQRRG